LPIPPRSYAELSRDFWHVLNVLNAPAGLLTPVGVVASAFVALSLFAVGAAALGRRWGGGLYLLIAPMLFALAASALHEYPFHGRLLIFLIPSIHLLVSEGTAVLTAPGGARLTFAAGAFLLYQPAFDVFWHRAIQERIHEDDSHGDLVHDLLDHLDALERKAARVGSRR
jgi:hypothetical protein